MLPRRRHYPRRLGCSGRTLLAGISIDPTRATPAHLYAHMRSKADCQHTRRNVQSVILTREDQLDACVFAVYCALRMLMCCKLTTQLLHKKASLAVMRYSLVQCTCQCSALQPSGCHRIYTAAAEVHSHPSTTIHWL